jgi:hypothetical protein
LRCAHACSPQPSQNEELRRACVCPELDEDFAADWFVVGKCLAAEARAGRSWITDYSLRWAVCAPRTVSKQRAQDDPIKIAETSSASNKRNRLLSPGNGDITMRIAIQADHGDEVSINTNVISVEQAVVTLQVKNPIYDSVAELEEVTLTIDKARDLAWALLMTADAVEFVSSPVTEIRSALNHSGGQPEVDGPELH